jgi:hypothetical protein
MSLRRRRLCAVPTYGYFASKYSRDIDNDPSRSIRNQETDHVYP